MMEKHEPVEFFWGGVRFVLSAQSVYVGPVDIPNWAWTAIDIWYDSQYCDWDLGEYMDRMFGPPPKFNCTLDSTNPLDRSGQMDDDMFSCGCCGPDSYDDFDTWNTEDWDYLYLGGRFRGA